MAPTAPPAANTTISTATCAQRGKGRRDSVPDGRIDGEIVGGVLDLAWVMIVLPVSSRLGFYGWSRTRPSFANRFGLI